uniref:Uncharacterized protein n=1 Tax=Arundo donax TaxID=35708 RepID=A0A0A9A7V0_ARUDO
MHFSLQTDPRVQMLIGFYGRSQGKHWQCWQWTVSTTVWPC